MCKCSWKRLCRRRDRLNRSHEPLTMTELDSALQNIEQERNPALDEAFSAWYP